MVALSLRQQGELSPLRATKLSGGPRVGGHTTRAARQSRCLRARHASEPVRLARLVLADRARALVVAAPAVASHRVRTAATGQVPLVAPAAVDTAAAGVVLGAAVCRRASLRLAAEAHWRGVQVADGGGRAARSAIVLDHRAVADRAPHAALSCADGCLVVWRRAFGWCAATAAVTTASTQSPCSSARAGPCRAPAGRAGDPAGSGAGAASTGTARPADHSGVALTLLAGPGRRGGARDHCQARQQERPRVHGDRIDGTLVPWPRQPTCRYAEVRGPGLDCLPRNRAMRRRRTSCVEAHSRRGRIPRGDRLAALAATRSRPSKRDDQDSRTCSGGPRNPALGAASCAAESAHQQKRTLAALIVWRLGSTPSPGSCSDRGARGPSDSCAEVRA